MKKFSFEINGEKYEVNVKKIDGKIADVEVNGTPYSVKMDKEEVVSVSAPAPKTVEAAPAPVVEKPEVKEVVTEKPAPVASTPKPSAGSKSIKAPLPGNVLKVNVAVGDTFKDGDVLMVMESMKMENNILAETSGTITKINIPAGKAVMQDEVLLEYN